MLEGSSAMPKCRAYSRREGTTPDGESIMKVSCLWKHECGGLDG